MDPDTDRNPGTPDRPPERERAIVAAKAAERALAAAGVAPEELDIIILGTSSPDRNYPSDACSVQAAIGAVNAVAFDISAACAGFIFAMNIVEGFFKPEFTRRR